jgi:hypothetical protein
MRIENPLNMRVKIQRHSLSALHYTVHLFHTDHGQFQRTFGSYNELEQALSELLIPFDLLERASSRFMNGYETADLGQHTFTREDLESYSFTKKPMNTEASISFLPTSSGVDCQIRCAGKLWSNEHLSLRAALDFAVKQRWLRPEDCLGITANPQLPAWNSAIETNPAELEMLGFRPTGTL